MHRLLRLALIFCIIVNSTNTTVTYCGHKYRTTSFATSHGFKALITTNVEGRHSKQDQLIYYDWVGASVQLFYAHPSGGWYRKRTDVTPPSFCNGGTLFSADVDGDSRDDLLCHKVNNFFSVMKYNRRHRAYDPEQDYAPGVECNVEDSFVLVGDFDGNKADDILCLDALAANFDSVLSYIYFGSTCTENHRNVRDHHPQLESEYTRDHHHHPRMKSNNVNCPIDLPGRKWLPREFIDTCDQTAFSPFRYLVVADANGDGRDDLVCDVEGAAFITYISSGSHNPALLFQQSGLPSANPATCIDLASETVPHVADVDGDGRDDVICVGTNLAPTSHPVAFSQGGTYQSPVDPTASNTCQLFCNTATPSTSEPLSFAATGDFNRDGLADLVCQFMESDGTLVTDIAFAHYVP